MICPNSPSSANDIALQAIRCSVRKAIRRGWFPQNEFDDLVQDVVLHLLQEVHRYDPDRATWGTFCSMVAQRWLLRRKSRQSAVGSAETNEVPEYDSLEDRHLISRRYVRSRTEIERSELRDDLEFAVHSLPHDLQILCGQFQEHENAADVAASLGISRCTVYRRFRLVREVISEHQLNEYC